MIIKKEENKMKMRKSLEKILFELNFKKHDEDTVSTDYTVNISTNEKDRKYTLVISLVHNINAVVWSVVGKDLNNETQVLRLASFKPSFLDNDEKVLDYIKRVVNLFKI